MSSSHTYQDSSFILGASKNLVLAYTVGMPKKNQNPPTAKFPCLRMKFHHNYWNIAMFISKYFSEDSLDLIMFTILTLIINLQLNQN